MVLFEHLLTKIEKTPDKTYLQFEDERISYFQLYKRIGQVATGLYEIGVRHGDKVCLMMENCPEYIDTWFALSYLRAVTVPVNIHLKGQGLKYILNHSDCHVIVLDDAYLPAVISALTEIKREIKLVVRTTSTLSPTAKGLVNDRMIYFHDFKNSLSNEWIPPVQTTSHINSILYTSGTTGLPKGVMLSEQAFLQSAKTFAEHMCQITANDILFTTLPLFHVNAQTTTVLGSIYSNATIALSPRFSASGFWDDVRFHDATIFNSLGSMIPILCKQPEKSDEREHRVRLTACAATPKEFWGIFERRFGVKIIEGYGLTETSGFCISNPIATSRPPSFGKPFPNVKAKVVDETMQEVLDLTIGEIVIKPPHSSILMDGYYKMPDQTLKTIKDGWFYTGDRGYRDLDGYFYFSNRMNECIRRRGENISSWEIEQAVNNHPKVLESAAVGVPSELGEEDVKIYIVLMQGTTVSPVEILDWCQEHMAYFMVPRYVEFIDEFPKTSTERIQKFKLIAKGIGESWDRENSNYKVNKTRQI